MSVFTYCLSDILKIKKKRHWVTSKNKEYPKSKQVWLSSRRRTWASLILDLADKGPQTGSFLTKWSFQDPGSSSSKGTNVPRSKCMARPHLRTIRLSLSLLTALSFCCSRSLHLPAAKVPANMNEYPGLCSITGRFSHLPIFPQLCLLLLFLTVFLAAFFWIWQSGWVPMQTLDLPESQVRDWSRVTGWHSKSSGPGPLPFWRDLPNWRQVLFCELSLSIFSGPMSQLSR